MAEPTPISCQWNLVMHQETEGNLPEIEGVNSKVNQIKRIIKRKGKQVR